MHSSANSDHSPCSSKAKLFHIEFSDLHVSKEDPVKPLVSPTKCQLLEAEYFADEASVFVPADVAAVVHSSEKETLRLHELAPCVALGRRWDGRGLLEPGFLALVRALVVEHMTKVIEAALLARSDAAGGFVVSSFRVRCIRSCRPFCCGRPA